MRLQRFQFPRPGKRASAFTFVEMLVSVAIGGMILAALASLMLYSARSFVAIGNYIDLDKASRNALDQMSRAVRQTSRLSSYSATALSFANVDGSTLSIAWNPSTGKVTMTQGSTNKTLLTQCDFLQFTISQRNPTPAVWGFYSATNNASQCKLVDVSWKCSRKILGKKINTESVQTARIVIRN
jgi:type II secretory pathway pseudopilin PulG